MKIFPVKRSEQRIFAVGNDQQHIVGPVVANQEYTFYSRNIMEFLFNGLRCHGLSAVVFIDILYPVYNFKISVGRDPEDIPGFHPVICFRRFRVGDDLTGAGPFKVPADVMAAEFEFRFAGKPGHDAGKRDSYS